MKIAALGRPEAGNRLAVTRCGSSRPPVYLQMFLRVDNLLQILILELYETRSKNPV